MEQRTMRAARMHSVGEPLRIDQVPVPQVRPTDVLVEVKACGIVPNLGNVLRHLQEWFPHLVLPRLPAIFGLDATGVIKEVGAQVYAFKPGDRVYVNPARYCGGCRACRSGHTTKCLSYSFNGYFGFGEFSQRMFDDYPYGGLCEFMTAPQYSLVKIPDNLPFETAARFGYLGTAYRALQAGGVGPSTTLLVNGISGTLGIGAALFGLAMGARRILGTGRNKELLAQVKALAPHRIEVFSTDDGGSIAEWARGLTDGEGCQVVIDSLGPGTPQAPMLDALEAMRRGGHFINIGAVAGNVPIDLHRVMDSDRQISGSVWVTTGQAQEMADMVESGQVDLSVFEHSVYALEDINTALELIGNRNGGFSNYVIKP
ncbi:MAG: alcohol dehydrogenase [Comamonadaceae bacterium]|nr:MAG: alcohol dehydrogenase [Comamonadaceae bacterium]